MITKIKNQTFLALLFMVLPIVVKAAEDPLDSGEIDPPPPAPIDENLIFLWVAAVLFVAYFFYKNNLKIETK